MTKEKKNKPKIYIKGYGNQIIYAIGGATVYAYNFVRKKINVLSVWQKILLGIVSIGLLASLVTISIYRGNAIETLKPIVAPYINEAMKDGEPETLVKKLENGYLPNKPCAKIGMKMDDFFNKCGENYEEFNYINYTVGGEGKSIYKDWEARFQNEKLVEMSSTSKELNQYTMKKIEKTFGNADRVTLKEFQINFVFDKSTSILSSIRIQQNGLTELKPEMEPVGEPMGGTSVDLPLPIDQDLYQQPKLKKISKKLPSSRLITSGKQTMEQLSRMATQGDIILQDCGRVGVSTLNEVMNRCGKEFEDFTDRKSYNSFANSNFDGRVQTLSYHYGTHRVFYYFYNGKLLVTKVLFTDDLELKFTDIRNKLGETDDIGRTGRVETYYDFRYPIGSYTLIFTAIIPSQDLSHAENCSSMIITTHPEFYHGVEFGWL
ncbi:hypothetical protein ACFO25_04060 [Paenactinomyces guangxiensis]|uniref:Uncharacterized protein n=1 Tax=Paenactinomyces guangxiensis TaxID=1490290 RepID=A0A7W1WP12_9BACL|nr:hypothetical protein [Paenactinomyces guangxiensis]MBA4493331.1 hypothetical protein [Paenactinomyces guangxiensis]MBH8593443.1 hypothetical protein [Paenactinomyces guangxiensis]